ncbi:hypothetical protein [Chitinophaga sp. LS1]|uniref:hypothetical protein n=1 Tax=Chitinophaga sp. LS1 TaxID=3051176 RepID=UPI002AAC0CE4|nr:hypothetical protein [Chitinophaga sp. LS1]WPV70278.1 hypothetical protein QQL36_16345 [Chitinophaga sp. LS1]
MNLIEKFETCTLPKAEWTHEKHFVMALWYCIHYPLPEAVDKICNGIKRYNESVGGENTDESGYHETITLFYIGRVADYVITNRVSVFTEEVVGDFLEQDFVGKEYMLRFYSREYLMSKEARLRWKAPDKTYM